MDIFMLQQGLVEFGHGFIGGKTEELSLDDSAYRIGAENSQILSKPTIQ
jgi:hypothetical protein